jgi:hypothetical protein
MKRASPRRNQKPNRKSRLASIACGMIRAALLKGDAIAAAQRLFSAQTTSGLMKARLLD